MNDPVIHSAHEHPCNMVHLNSFCELVQICAAIGREWKSGGVTIELAATGNIFFLLCRHSRCVRSTRHPARPQFCSGDLVLGRSVRLRCGGLRFEARLRGLRSLNWLVTSIMAFLPAEERP